MLKMRSSRSRSASPQLAAAGLWSRTRAFGIDYLPIAAYLMALTGIVAALRLTPLRRSIGRVYANPYTAQLADTLAFDLPVIAYFALCEATLWEATPGKRRRGLRVVTTAGERATLTQAAARIALKFLPWEIAHTSLWHTPAGRATPDPPRRTTRATASYTRWAPSTSSRCSRARRGRRSTIA